MAIDLKNLPRPRICYLEIPATDSHTSAEFYEGVFGWNIRRRDSAQPSFDDPSGVSGAFVTYLKAAPEPGLLPSIWVDDINAMVAKVKAHGGEIVEYFDFQNSPVAQADFCGELFLGTSPILAASPEWSFRVEAEFEQQSPCLLPGKGSRRFSA